MAVQWGLAQQPNAFDRAFDVGLQLATMNRQRQQEEAARSALSAYAMDPTSDDNFNALAQAAPEYAIQVRGQRDAAAQQARQQDMRRRAASGDTDALAELAGIDLAGWNTVSIRQREEMNDAATVMGNVAMQIGQLPEDQRPAAWDAQIDQLSQRYPQLASERGQYSPENLAATINEAQMFQQFYQSQQPDYMAIPEGGTLVNTRDPQAVQQFGAGGQPPMGGAPSGVPQGSPLSQPAPQQNRAPQPLVPGNLPTDIRNRVRNPDGSISTVRTISIGVDGGEVVIPTVINGRVVSDDEAIRHYEQTGENFGTFRTPQEATAFAQALHNNHAQQLQGQQNVISFDDFRQALVIRGADTARAQLAQSGAAVSVRSPDEARTLPSGTRIILPDGSEGRVP